MANLNPTIVVASLDDKDLKSAIDKLVNYVQEGTGKMKTNFDQTIDAMKAKLQELGNVKVDLSQTLDGIEKAKQQATKGKNSGEGSSTKFAEETVGALEQEIKAEEKRRKEMALGSEELLKQNKIIADNKAELKSQLMTEEEKNKAIERQNAALEKQREKQLKKQQSPFIYDYNKAMQLSTNSLSKAEKKLRELESVHQRMKSSGIFDEVKIRKVEKDIDNLKTKIERLRNSSTQPKTLNEVLGMDENSIDAITRKMAALKKVQIDPKNKQEVSQLSSEYNRLKKSLDEILGKNAQLVKSNTALGNAFGYIRNRIIYALTLGTITTFVKQIYVIRGQYELLERSLGVLVNSFQKGSQIFQELNAMAIKSPFTLLELAGAAKQLTAYNFEANEVVDTTRRLADISAALGVPMERLTYNLGQIRAQTVLTARDARDFANAGLPIVKALSDYFTELEGKVVTTGDVYSRMSKKMVSYTDVMAVLNKMTDEGGKFFDFQAKQAQTLKVQLANLNLAFNNMLNDMGKENQSLLSIPLKSLKYLLENWRSINRAIWDVIYAIGVFGATSVVYAVYANYVGGVVLKLKNLYVIGNKIIEVVKMIGLAMKTAFMNPATWIAAIAFAIIDLTQQFFANRKEIAEINKQIKENINEQQEALQAYLNTLEKTNELEIARKGELSDDKAKKAWSQMEGEIGNLASSASTLLTNLIQISDLNQRITVGADLLKSIEQAHGFISDIKDDTFEISHSQGWGGIFGEGLADDLKDYNTAVDNLNGSYAKQVDLVDALKEAQGEIDITANSITSFLSRNNITDPFQIAEILEHVKNAIKSKVPQIQGEAAKLFDIRLDEKISEYTNGAYNKNTSLWKIFMEDLRKHSSAAFSGITDDIYNANYELSEQQKEAIEKNLERFKKTMPEYYNAVADMVQDANRLNIEIGIKFGVEQKSDFQKEYEKRIDDNIALAKTIFGKDALMMYAPKSKDDYISWMSDLEKQLENIKKNIDSYQKIGGDFGNNMVKSLEKDRNIIQSVIEMFKPEVFSDFQWEFLNRFGQASQDLMKYLPSSTDEFDKWIEQKEKRIEEIDKKLELYSDANGEYFDSLSKPLVEEKAQLQLIVNEFKKLSDFQKDFSRRAGDNYYDLLPYSPKAGEEFAQWVERLQNDIQKYKEAIELLKLIGSADPFAIPKMEEYTKKIEFMSMALEMYGQAIEKSKKEKTSQKDELGEALKQEISLIKDMQSNYDKLRKAGVGDFEAIELAARGYEATLERVNNVLSKYGIDKFNANQFAGKNVKELLEFLVKQREILAQNPKVKTSAIEALDVEIQKLQVDAKTYDMKKITDGLNSELAKIDEQYELAVELQANADLGNQLIDMFGIDTTDFPKSIDDLVSRYQSAVWDAIAKEKPDVDLSQYDILDVDFSKLFSDKDIDSEFMKGLLDAQKAIKQQTKKWAQDVYNQTKQLEYNLADTNGKIALKEQEISELRDKYANEQNAKQKELYASQIKEQENVLAELKEGILQMMPAYEALFGGIANHSAALTRTLAKRLKSAYEQAKEGGKNEKGEYTYIDPKSGEYVTLTEHKLGIEIDKVNKKLLESQPLWQKLKEDFTKGADDEVDFAQGLMDIADEMEKVADGIHEIGNIAEGLGADEETLEIINDIGASIDGVATAAKGIAQIQSGDVIGGTVNVIKGAWGAISSWFDNSNKRITRKVERSERTVRQLELAYKDLEYQVEKSMGTAETAARRATIANKQQQLEELKRQLALEESRKKKNQDEDKMLELRSNIKDLQYEINNMTEEVVNNLTGSDVKSAAEEFVDTWVEAWKAGETTLDAIGEKMDEVIQNIVKKAMTQEIVGALLQPLYNELDRMTSIGSEGGEELTIEELRQLAARAGIVSNDINTALGAFYGNLEQLGLVAKTQEQEQQLSALQQGIQGVTEQTANALEGYMNGLSQQAYLRNDLLMQIRDALTLTDNDMAMGVQAQILLQLQQSYVLIQSIHSLMGNWTIPDGSGIRVQLL